MVLKSDKDSYGSFFFSVHNLVSSSEMAGDVRLIIVTSNCSKTFTLLNEIIRIRDNDLGMIE